MKKEEIKNLRNKPVKDFGKMLSDKKKELVNARASIFAGKEKNIKKARNLRVEIAKILTIRHEKEILEDETKKGVNNK
ncbi:50S ribosomal protein L29 [Candidatus Woesebacteria bacterium]|nr:50S ribosomal protein L29 [Candidatus Woesebacteria bacterium]